ncbi:MAG: transketolase [Capsulimonadaceae bacterium]|nr:transketolase [Capsulimonadaceae bacterium]
MPSNEQTRKDLARQLRIDSIRCTTKAGSGHPTSSMSAADLMAVLMLDHLKYDPSKPKAPYNDHLIFSKGHAAPLLFAMYKAAGWITDDEMMTLREYGSRIEGHPTPILPYVDVATGSLGQGLPIGVGVALCGKYLDKLPYKVWILCGDSELAEGSIWEGFDKAGHYKLDNLITIVDVNRLGQRGETELGWNLDAYAARVEAFGCRPIKIDGHDLAQVEAAFKDALSSSDGRPPVILAKTIKGAGYSKVADQPNWHGKGLPADMAAEAIAELGGPISQIFEVAKPEPVEPVTVAYSNIELPKYAFGTKEATRKAYGDALKAIGYGNPDVVVLDAEVSNSTYAEEFKKGHPERFFEMWIAEQQLVAAAVGFGVRGKKAFASTFAAFFTRAYDFIRMAAISRANFSMAGSHAGVSIGEDGASQMALEDIAMMRAVHGSTVLYPSDANQTAALVEQMASSLQGIVYMRTTREKTPILYGPDEKFAPGGSKVLRSSAADKATVIGAGITLHEALKAYDTLKASGIDVRVIDLYSVKPVDAATLKTAAKETGALIVVEDHWAEGGLGDAVLDAFVGEAGGTLPKVVKLAVREIPSSGKPAEMLAGAGIDAAHIVAAVKKAIA